MKQLLQITINTDDNNTDGWNIVLNLLKDNLEDFNVEYDCSRKVTITFTRKE